MAFGSATHLVFEQIDLSVPVDAKAVQATLSRLVESGQLAESLAAAIDTTAITSFFDSDLGQLAQRTSGCVFREWPFTYGLDAATINAKSGGEIIILQGIIDMIIQTDNGLVIVDFKTDRVAESEIAKRAKKLQKDTGIKLLWGTTNAFSHRRFMAGAGTNPSPQVFAYAAAQIKKAMEVTKYLGGAGYVFWGGREGYETLLNTDMKRELDHLAALLHMAVDYKKKIRFGGQFYIEPKPKEPTKHQYDFDAGNCYAFLQKYDLLKHFKLNIEANHATLAGHSFQHELQFCADNGILGSVDANRGDLFLGWDTDQFPTDLYDTTLAMVTLLTGGGFTTGGLNFDAKLRRQSTDPVDLFYAHIGGMDAFSRGLKNAAKMIKDKRFDKAVKARYAGWNKALGKKIESGKVGFEELQAYTLKNGEPEIESGRQEMLENMLNEYI